MIKPTARRARRRRGRATEASGLEFERFPVPGDTNVTDPLLAENGSHGIEAARLTVDDERAADRTAQPTDPGPELVAVGMGGVAADGLDVGPALVLLTHDAKHLFSGLNPPAERVLRLESDEQDQVLVVSDPVRQMMENASGL